MVVRGNPSATPGVAPETQCQLLLREREKGTKIDQDPLHLMEPRKAFAMTG